MGYAGLLILGRRGKRFHLLSSLVGMWFYMNIHCCSIFRTEENKAKEICPELGADGICGSFAFLQNLFFTTSLRKFCPPRMSFPVTMKSKFWCVEGLSLWSSYQVRGGLIREMFEFNSFQVWPRVWWPEALFRRNNSDSCYISVFHPSAVNHVRCSR